MKTIYIIALASLPFLGSGCRSTDSEYREVPNRSYETNEVANRQKADFIRMTDTHLRDVEDKINSWKIEAKDASGSLKEERYEQITTLERKLDKARVELNKLKTAPMGDFEKFKGNVEDAVKDLDDEFKSATKTFR